MDELAASRNEVAAGERFSREHTFSVEEAIAFALAAGDDNPLHHDAEFASGTRFGRLIVSGTHTTALLLGLTASHFAKRGAVIGVGFSVSFERPVYGDERVTLEWTVDTVHPCSRGSGQRVEMKGCLRDARGKVCVSATGTVLIGIDLSAATADPVVPDGRVH
jgi:3-hydroxybutyryl-CoA dehydratase